MPLLRVSDEGLACSDSQPATAYAARELCRLHAAAGRPLRAKLDEGLRHHQPPTATIWTEAGATILAGEHDELLPAVYRYAESLGWRWFYPGPLGEVWSPSLAGAAAPRPQAIDLRVVDLSYSADPLWLAEARQLLGWLPRRGLRTLVIESALDATVAAQALEPEASRACVTLEVRRRAAGATIDRDLDLPLGAHASRRNRQALLRISEQVRAGAGQPVRLPYADAGALANLAGPLATVIAGDLRALHDCDTRRLELPLHGRLATWLYPLNLHLAALCAADPEVDPRAVRDEWCAALYPDVAEPMRTYLSACEQAMAPLWRLRLPAGDLADHGEWAELDKLAAAFDELPAVRRYLATAAQRSRDRLARLRLDQDLAAFDLTYLHLQAWLLRYQGSLGHRSLALHAAARETVAQIVARLGRLPTAAGVAWHSAYRQPVSELAAWCGYEAR